MDSRHHTPDLARASEKAANNTPTTRIKSQDLLQQMRELEIDHDGRIYKLRLTHSHKLILTA